VAAADVGWSPSEIAVRPDIRVRAGRRYAIVVTAPSAAPGAYGMAYGDGDPYARGAALYSADGGATWGAEPGRDLKFETSVEDR
jgi:hypothetical protein